ncbi:MAG: hypothetical protein LH471_08105 [Salinibacterium sp.]|nr:hypothetical protein [Salinibacterium sp.]
MAGLDEHPNCLRFDRKLWVSELPREELYFQLVAQRAWDDQHERVNRWQLALALGAAVGVAVALGVSAWLGAPPALNLFTLPIGFGVGAVLGARVNEWLRPRRAADAALPPRPTVAAMTKVPRRVAAMTPLTATAREIIELSTPPR